MVVPLESRADGDATDAGDASGSFSSVAGPAGEPIGVELFELEEELFDELIGTVLFEVVRG